MMYAQGQKRSGYFFDAPPTQPNAQATTGLCIDIVAQ
jgi:hypothetical protein